MLPKGPISGKRALLFTILIPPPPRPFEGFGFKTAAKSGAVCELRFSSVASSLSSPKPKILSKKEKNPASADEKKTRFETRPTKSRTVKMILMPLKFFALTLLDLLLSSISPGAFEFSKISLEF